MALSVPLHVIKIGGNVIDNSQRLHYFLKDFSELEGAKVLVHGGGKVASDMLNSMGIEPLMIEGRRVTDIETLRVVTMVYAGLINKNMVAQLQRYGCDAMGLTGADGNLIRAVKRPAELIDYGMVGDLAADGVDVARLSGLIRMGLIPVFCAITHDGKGQLLNTNADTVAATLATALSAVFSVNLVYCFEKTGVMRTMDDENSVIRQMSHDDYRALSRQGIVAGGMLPKLQSAFNAIEAGVKNVYIGKAEELPLLKEQLFGTRLFK